MSESTIISIGQQAIYTALLVSAPLLVLSMAVGIIISVFQAATQINEQTMTFIPKILAIVAALIIFGPWMIKTLTEFTTVLYENVNIIVH